MQIKLQPEEWIKYKYNLEEIIITEWETRKGNCIEVPLLNNRKCLIHEPHFTRTNS